MTVDALMKSKSLEHPILNPKKKDGTPAADRRRQYVPKVNIDGGCYYANANANASVYSENPSS